MSVEGNDFVPPIPAPPYQLPELELGPNCLGCVSIDVCTGIVVRSETASMNQDLMRFQGTPTHDRVVSEIFTYGPTRLEQQYDAVQTAILDCPGGVELMYETPQDETGLTYFDPQPLAPTFGIQSVQRGLRPVETADELRARGFEPVFNEADERIVRVGVGDQVLVSPNHIAFQQVGNVEAFSILEKFRDAAKPPTEALPENFPAMIAEAVHTAVHTALAQQLPQSRRSHR